jgi:predicted metal-dependent enzyme (double-stranded beta helix superfamily)
MNSPSASPLRDFVLRTAELVHLHAEEAELLPALRPALAALVARDDWLPDELARPHPEHYRQYLLHADAAGRFSVVSFVWGPGQTTPIHDHTVWGLVGVLRGEELSQPYALDARGVPHPAGPAERLRRGDVAAVSPALGDVHRVSNAFADQVSISIHVYGANIGTVRRHVFAPDGQVKDFVSGYSNAWVPNLWGPAA